MKTIRKPTLRPPAGGVPVGTPLRQDQGQSSAQDELLSRPQRKHHKASQTQAEYQW